MPPIDTSPNSGKATPTPLSDEHLAVLTDALRDDDEHYEDPPLTD